ncbi:hypothetical protein MTO96_000228 [Rhipicephalus appendiculatus]
MVGTNVSEQAQGRCPYYVYQSSESLWLDDVYARRRRTVEWQLERGGPDRVVDRTVRLLPNEIGVSTQNPDPWTSLMKIRLRCIDSAAANFSFDEIHASYWVRDLENGVLFGAFVSVTRTWDGAAHYDSAVCAFSLQDIEQVFASSTLFELTQGDIYTLSRPLPPSQALSPRPGVTCPPGPRTISSADARFWVTHPLVTQTPKQRHKRLFYAHSGVAFRSLVAFVLNETWGAWHRSLYLFTDVDVRQYSTDACEGRHLDCPSCLLDPFCGWDGNKCLPHTVGSTRRTC